MAYRKILEWPDRRLKLRADKIDNFGSEELKKTLIDMEDTIRVAVGAGLAAPQIGESIQAVIINMAGVKFTNPDDNSEYFQDPKLWLLLNPRLSNIGGTLEWEEGCLSVPWHTATVTRGEYLDLEYETFSGEQKRLLLKGSVAGIIQHECDHLNGKLFLDRISRLKSSRIKKSIEKKRKKLRDIKLALTEDDEIKIGHPKKYLSLSRKEIKKRKKIKKNNR